MKTNDHYNPLTDPDLYKLAKLLNMLVLEYSLPVGTALTTLQSSFKLTDIEMGKIRGLAKLGLE